jgi:hypothetical protein
MRCQLPDDVRRYFPAYVFGSFSFGGNDKGGKFPIGRSPARMEGGVGFPGVFGIEKRG